jgi:NTP pyrophosphatase (non-canonical NTP hydrolase)
MEINNLVKKSFDTSKEKGFWKHYDSVLKKISKGNNYSEEEVEAVKNAFINQKIMLVVSELSEMMEALRKSKNVECGDKILKELKEQFSENPKLFYMRFIHHVKDTFEDELADVMIRLGDLVGKLEVDIETHIDLKQKFNSLREEMYGKKF